jgi:hypothetical protein
LVGRGRWSEGEFGDPKFGDFEKGGIGVKDIWYWRADVVYGRV